MQFYPIHVVLMQFYPIRVAPWIIQSMEQSALKCFHALMQIYPIHVDSLLKVSSVKNRHLSMLSVKIVTVRAIIQFSTSPFSSLQAGKGMSSLCWFAPEMYLCRTISTYLTMKISTIQIKLRQD